MVEIGAPYGAKRIATQIDQRYRVTTRTFGALSAIGGGSEMFAGGVVATGGGLVSATGVGSPVGVPAAIGGGVLFVHGADTASAGLRQFVTGVPSQTLTNKALQSAGMSPQQAALTDGGIGLIGGSVAGFASATRTVPVVRGGVMPYVSVVDGVIAAESVPLNTRVVLQGVTDRAVAELAANPGLARELMSPSSYNHLAEGTSLAHASYGKAVERLSARIIERDPALSSIFSYQSKPFKSTPDFFGFEGYNMRPLDITTARSVTEHAARPYGSYTEIVTYPGLPSNLVFPR